MTQHTPGPWKAIVNATIDHGAIINDQNIEIAKVDCRYGAIGEPESNARLIAAAPELLEALNFIVEQIANEKNATYTLGAYTNGVGIDMARKAIAKAKGK